jgi:acetyl esterase
MPLDPPLQVIIDALSGARDAEPPADLDQRRAQSNQTMLLIGQPRGEGVVSTDHTIPVSGGEIVVRVLHPRRAPSGPGAADGPLPTFFSLHGGGWFQGNLDTAEVEAGPMTGDLGCVTVLPGYRLAPEHPFPIPLDDCVAAYEWMLANADELGIDRDHVVVGGQSAGANLAAALALVIRDRGLHQPAAQLLDVPALDLTLASPSMATESAGGLSGAEVEQFAAWYLDGHDPKDPLASPLHADDVSGLPPTVVLVAEMDPVRDDGERWVTRLHEAGVPAAGIRVQAQLHGSWIIPVTITSRLIPEMRRHVLREAFAGTLVPGFA